MNLTSIYTFGNSNFIGLKTLSFKLHYNVIYSKINPFKYFR